MSITLEHINYIYSEGTAYEKKALKDINLEIPHGQFVGIIGHTGSGKSTLILDQIALLHEKQDMTVILVSHSMEDIAKYVERIIVMNRGEKMYDGTPREVFAHYKELEKVGLAAPQVTYIMNALKENGIPVSAEATTVEEAADEIMRVAAGKKIRRTEQ